MKTSYLSDIVSLPSSLLSFSGILGRLMDEKAPSRQEKNSREKVNLIYSYTVNSLGGYNLNVSFSVSLPLFIMAVAALLMLKYHNNWSRGGPSFNRYYLFYNVLKFIDPVKMSLMARDGQYDISRDSFIQAASLKRPARCFIKHSAGFFYEVLI